MKNIEKYYEEIKQKLQKTNAENLGCAVFDIRMGSGDCGDYDCKECCIKSFEWLNQEYEEPILDDAEREYLSAVIKPFRNKVKNIVKISGIGNSKEQYIRIVLGELDFMNFPNFNKNTGMYKGMEPDRLYSLEELGL